MGRSGQFSRPGFVRHAVNLHFDFRSEAANDGGARGLRVAEEFGVDLIHRGEVLTVAEVDTDTDYVSQGSARTFEHQLHVVDSDAGFVFDVAT
jgi:hypothetical protein